MTGRITEFIFFTTQSLVPYEEQVLAYGIGNLVADIGGFLGLLLGSSIFSAYKEAIEFLLRKKIVK